MLIEDLTKLTQQFPGASRNVAWTPGGTEIDWNGDAYDVAAVGCTWPIRHVIDRVELFLTKRLNAVFKVEVFDVERWSVLDNGINWERRDNSAIATFPPVATNKIRVLADDTISEIKNLSVFRYLPELKNGKPAWPEDVATRGLERKMLAAKAEPSFESLARYGLSMPVWINTGLKDFGEEQGVAWDGTIFHRFRGIFMALGESAVRLRDVRETVRRGLLDNELPAVIVEGQIGDITVRQTSFAAPPFGAANAPALFVRIELRNTGAAPYKVALQVVAGKDPRIRSIYGTVNGEGAMVGAEEYPDPPVLRFADGVLIGPVVRASVPAQDDCGHRGPHHPDEVFLAAISPCKTGALPDSLGFNLSIAPGQSTIVDLVAPLAAAASECSPDAVKKLQRCNFDEALAAFRAYWEKILAPAMKIALPEERLNHLYRNVLAQLFMTAHGDVLYYGTQPGGYDKCLFGLEEGYAMLAFAMCGLQADATRYMDGTYLLPEFVAKIERYEKWEHRHQQYRNGLQPLYAIEAYHFNRDRAWIGKHVPLLIDCAEWTIANRRKTMVLENGKKPVHWGLLEKWSYGGDIANQQCYPLFPNFVCCLALQETAELFKELGETAKAGLYAKEAAEYRDCILGVVDAIYRSDAKPPFLPLHTEATSAEGEYYQLFGSVVVDQQFFDFTDKRANYLGDFLENDNRSFCLLPRFRVDLGPGGLDAIYGMGHILSKLHSNKIREFLLGFYAFQAFNMDHDCFGSRESNVVYSSDLHLREPYATAAVTDPLACSSVVSVLLLRHALITEERRRAGDYTGELLLLYGAPRQWFKKGETISVQNAPTHFGNVSYTVTHRTDGVIEAKVSFPKTSDCKRAQLRLRHPEGKTLASVRVNGKVHKEFDAKEELVFIEKPIGDYTVEATFA